MDFLKTILTEFLDFFRLGGMYGILMSGNYSSLKTLNGIIAVLVPFAPFLMFGEMGLILYLSKKNTSEYKITLLIVLVNRVLGHLARFSIILLCYGLLSRFAIAKVTMTWYWFIYAYLFYELGTYVYHFTSHKVRLLWCFHSIHHSTEELNCLVTLRTFYLENLYTEIVRTSIIVLSGTPLLMYFLIMAIDSIWGAFVHMSDKVLADGRLGILERLVLTPSHHRVHHATSPLYLDTNYSSMLTIWDQLFGTYQKQDRSIPLEYGVNREIDANNFWDVYFGEFTLLWKDIKSAKNIGTKIKYVFMPPGWSPDNKYTTAKHIRREFIKSRSQEETLVGEH